MESRCCQILGIVLVACSLSTVADLSEQEIEHLINATFHQPAQAPQSSVQCSYSVKTHVQDVGTMVERLTINGEESKGWHLISLNGETPKPTVLNEYTPTSRQRNPTILSFDFIDFESVTFLAQTNEAVELSFKVKETYSREEFGHHLVHSMKIKPRQGELTEIRSVADVEFRVQPWFKVEEYEHLRKFRFDPNLGRRVLASVSVTMKARFGRDRIDRTVQFEYEDLDCSAALDSIHGNGERDVDGASDSRNQQPQPKDGQ